ncbi:hypothetical protein AX15_003451 [Amanita polypyramis BW_CC]|nr:hypothetical protein AX15_003451 [Amanita polypyramis BW_CC]
MRLLSHILMASTLSLLGTGLTSYALPMNANALGPKLESPTHPLADLAKLRLDSLKLIGREIHSADYGTAGKPQNTSSVASSSSSSGNSSSPKAASVQDEQRRGKIRLMHVTNQVSDGDQVRNHEHKHKRDATDYHAILPRGNPNEIASNYQMTPSSNSMTFVGRTHSMANADSSIDSSGNSACGYGGYYPYMRMRYVRKPKYGSFLRSGEEDSPFGQGAFSYRELLSYDTLALRHIRRLSPTEGGFWARAERPGGGADISGDGGPRGIRHFDPREVDRMTAVYALSHGVPVDN